MRKIKLISIITVVMALLLAGCGSNEKKITELTENAELALEHDEYDVSFEYYKQILDMDPENLKARYGIEEIFETSLNKKAHDLSGEIYSYVSGMENNEDKLSRLQEMIIKYDTRILESAEVIMETAFFSNTIGAQKMSDINMTLGSFINSYDADFRYDFMSVYSNGASDIEQDIVFFDEYNSALNYAPKVYINVHEISENSFDVCLYVKDHMKDAEGNPKVYCGTYDSKCQSYSDAIPEEEKRERVTITLFTESMNGDITEIKDTGTAYDKTGDYWILLNDMIPIPEQMWGAILYNQTDNEYYAVVYGGAILIDAEEADMLVQLSMENSCMSVCDYYGYWR